MNQFELAFKKKLIDTGFTPVKRGPDLYWRNPDERGILYDTAEAVVRALPKLLRSSK